MWREAGHVALDPLLMSGFNLQRPTASSNSKREVPAAASLELTSRALPAAVQREESVAAGHRTHGLGHLAVVQARTRCRHHRPLTGVLLTLPVTVEAAWADALRPVPNIVRARSNDCSSWVRRVAADPFLPLADFAAIDRSTLELDIRSRRRESRRQRKQSFAAGHHRPAKDPG
jgi:hypothetical protein